jgi:hypothetical protein
MKSYARSGGIGLIAVFALTGLAACGTEKLSDKDVAAGVRNQALAPRGITGARVTCPAETEAKRDEKIRCSVSDADKNKGTVTATVLDEDGKLGRYKADVDKLQVAVVEKKATAAGSSKGIDGDVDCPDTTKPKKGAIYFCTADIRGSGIGIVLVTQKDAASNVEVKVQRRRLRTAQIERNISKAVRKQGINADVKCPRRVTSQKGKTFTCKVRNPANGREIRIVATQKDDEGNFDLEAKR